MVGLRTFGLVLGVLLRNFVKCLTLLVTSVKSDSRHCTVCMNLDLLEGLCCLRMFLAEDVSYVYGCGCFQTALSLALEVEDDEEHTKQMGKIPLPISLRHRLLQPLICPSCRIWLPPSCPWMLNLSLPCWTSQAQPMYVAMPVMRRPNLCRESESYHLSLLLFKQSVYNMSEKISSMRTGASPSVVHKSANGIRATYPFI
jgi:hypothetical protein